MTKSWRRRTAGGYQASVVWVTRPATGAPNRHSDAMRVDPTRPGEEGMSYLERSPIWSVHTRTTAGATRRDGMELVKERISEQLTKALLERAMQAEMTEHPG